LKETQEIQNIGIEDSQGNRIVDQRQVPKIWENYVTELYDRPNRPETLEVEPEEEVDTGEKGLYILQILLFYSQGNRIVDQRQVPKIWENYVTELYDRPNRPETLGVEPEEEVDTGEKGPYILQIEVEKVIKEKRNRKATGDDDVPGDVLKLLGEGGLKILTKLINTIYETGEWPKDFTEVTMIALKKKTTQARKDT